MFGRCVVLLCLVVFLGCHAEETIDSSNGVDIHILEVGQADAQLIVYKGASSNFTVLVDCPEDNWQSSTLAKLVEEKIRWVTGGSMHIDVAVLTHLHLDHCGYVGYGGFWYLIEKAGVTFDKFIDRDAGVIPTTRQPDSECTKDTIEWHNIGTITGTAVKWVCWATDPANTAIYSIREVAQVCSSTQIATPQGSGLSFTIVEADALGSKMKSGALVAGDHHKDKLPTSENDYSVGFVLNFGKFRYATFGDLDGQYETSSYGYTYNNEESDVAPRVGEVDVYHVNHHGSAHSSNQDFLDTLSPSVSIISCGTDNSYGHPDQTTLDKLLPISQVYLTEKGNPEASYGNSIIADGDITIQVAPGGRSYTVSSVNGGTQKYSSKGITAPTCKV